MNLDHHVMDLELTDPHLPGPLTLSFEPAGRTFLELHQALLQRLSD
jgi:hypothetical protein